VILEKGFPSLLALLVVQIVHYKLARTTGRLYSEYTRRESVVRYFSYSLLMLYAFELVLSIVDVFSVVYVFLGASLVINSQVRAGGYS
jgi:hypothetical protein